MLRFIALWRIAQYLSLKSSGPKGRAGSSPALGTIKPITYDTLGETTGWRQRPQQLYQDYLKAEKEIQFWRPFGEALVSWERRSKERYKTEVRPALNVPSFWIFGGHGGFVADCIFSEVSAERPNVLHLGVFIEPLNR